MKDALKKTLDVVRAIANASEFRTSRRSPADFLADRIIQATAEPTLLAAMERLAGLLAASPGEVGRHEAFVEFIKAVHGSESPSVLAWLREYPRVAAMVVMLKHDEYESTAASLELPDMVAESGTALPAARSEIVITVTCLSPLAHGADTKAGNATLFRRMSVLSTTGAVLALPFYAGNALRGQIRDLLADDLIRSLGLTPRRDNPPVTLWFFHALYAGGALEENSVAAKKLSESLGANGAIKAQGMHEFRDMLPGLSLLGCALGNRIICGRARFADLRPACTQWANGGTDVAQLFEWLYLTRREDHENHEEHSGMIVNTECLRTGVVLHGGVDLDTHATEIERAALGRGLKLLAERGYLGAENRRGFGQVRIELSGAPDPGPYEEFIAGKKNEVLAYLEGLGAVNARG